MTTAASQKPIWREHIGLGLSAGLTLLIVLRVLAVGRFEPETALGIVQVAGTSNVLIAGLIASLPVVTWILLMEAVTRWSWRLRDLTKTKRVAFVVALGMPALLVLSVLPYFYVLLLVVVPTVLWCVVGISAWRGKRLKTKRMHPTTAEAPDAPRTMTRAEQAISRTSSYAALLFITIGSSWMPTEAVSADGGEPFTAYIVGERGADTVVLPVDRDRGGLQTIPSADLRRSYCESRDWLSVTVFQLGRPPAYEDCPDQ